MRTSSFAVAGTQSFERSRSMFSGIVKGIGEVLAVDERGGDRRLVIGIARTGLRPPALGASIAVNGACLTAAAVGADRFEADVSRETLAVTTLGLLAPGAPVNLEPSLALGDPLDGHLVSGHVDGVARVALVEPAARSLVVAIDLPPGLARYVARKGSIAVDGVSLTVNDVAGDRFNVNIVPHTRDATIIAHYRPGTPVNVEIDMLARYVERMLGSDRDAGAVR
jgi:riboflavin synthase